MTPSERAAIARRSTSRECPMSRISTLILGRKLIHGAGDGTATSVTINDWGCRVGDPAATRGQPSEGMHPSGK
jgi:hypothetical protein